MTELIKQLADKLDEVIKVTREFETMLATRSLQEMLTFMAKMPKAQRAPILDSMIAELNKVKNAA